MPHKDFKLSFDDFRILSVSFSVNEDFSKKKTIPINTQISVAHQYDKKEKSLGIRLKVSSAQEDIPFFFNVEGEGKFGFEKEPDDEVIKNVSHINAPAIIFPYIRETIADLTRRAGFKPLHLPPVNFVRFSEKAKTPKKKTPKAKPMKKVKK